MVNNNGMYILIKSLGLSLHESKRFLSIYKKIEK